MDTKDKIESLKKVKELISTPEKWVRGSYTMSNGGKFSHKIQDVNKTGCAAYCLMGAVFKVGYDDSTTSLMREELRKTYLSMRGMGDGEMVLLTEFNDESKHSDVINLIDLTIERLQENV